jgi:membrane protease YdiL (CAAX protease family)
MSEQTSVIPRFPKVWQSIGWIALYFLIQIICSIAAIAVIAVKVPGLLEHLQTNPAKAQINPAVGVAVMWGIIVSGMITLGILWLNLRKDRRADRLGIFASSRLSLPATLGTGLALVAGAMALTWVYTTYVIPGAEMQDQMKAMLNAIPPGFINTTLKFLAVAVIAPIIEEVLFRGYLQTAFINLMNPHLAIWLAAFIFALVHMQPMALPALMVLGASFGYFYHRTGSLKMNIGLHILNNSLALIFS